MIIAVPVSNGRVGSHFGHMEQFLFFQVDEATGAITAKEQKDAPPHKPGVLPKWLHEEGVNVVLAGNMGERAQRLLGKRGIEVVLGVAGGDPEQTVMAYLAGELSGGENQCDADGHHACGH